MKKALPVITAMILAACGGSDNSPELEQAITAANGQAAQHAKRYLAASIRFPTWTSRVTGDAMQTESCPQGDGWASVEFVHPDGATFFKMQCPTFATAEYCVDEIPEVPQSDIYKRMTGTCMDRAD